MTTHDLGDLGRVPPDGDEREPAVADDLAAGRLVQVLDDWTPPYPGLCLYYPSRRHMPASLRAFVALVRERLAAEP